MSTSEESNASATEKQNAPQTPTKQTSVLPPFVGEVNYRIWLAKYRREKELKEIIAKKPTRKAGAKRKRQKHQREPQPKKHKPLVTANVSDEETSLDEDCLSDEEDQDRANAVKALEELKYHERIESERQQEINQRITDDAQQNQMTLADIAWQGLTGVASAVDDMVGYDGSFGAHLAKNEPLRRMTGEWAKTQQVTKTVIQKYAGWGIAGIVLVEYLNYRGIKLNIFPEKRVEEESDAENL